MTLEDYPAIKRWFAKVRARPQVPAGLAVGKELKSESPATDEQARRHLFGLEPAATTTSSQPSRETP